MPSPKVGPDVVFKHFAITRGLQPPTHAHSPPSILVMEGGVHTSGAFLHCLATLTSPMLPRLWLTGQILVQVLALTEKEGDVGFRMKVLTAGYGLYNQTGSRREQCVEIECLGIFLLTCASYIMTRSGRIYDPFTSERFMHHSTPHRIGAVAPSSRSYYRVLFGWSVPRGPFRKKIQDGS